MDLALGVYGKQQGEQQKEEASSMAKHQLLDWGLPEGQAWSNRPSNCFCSNTVQRT